MNKRNFPSSGALSVTIPENSTSAIRARVSNDGFIGLRDVEMFAALAFKIIETKKILERFVFVKRALLNLLVQFRYILNAIALRQAEQLAFDKTQVPLQVNFQTFPLQFFWQDIQFCRNLFE